MITATPYNNPMMGIPSLPMPNDVVKMIHKHVDDRLDEVMAGKDEKLYKEFEKYICHIMKKHKESCSHHDYAGEEVPYHHKKSPMEALYSKIHCCQKHIHEGKSIMEVEKELYEKHPDMSHEQKRVFASLLRTDGPYTLSGMIGIPYDEYIEHMEKIGEYFID